MADPNGRRAKDPLPLTALQKVNSEGHQRKLNTPILGQPTGEIKLNPKKHII